MTPPPDQPAPIYPDRLHRGDPKPLTDDEKLQLEQQNSRLVPSHKAVQLEQQAQRHWDLFYKRNETRFFKDRHWTTREFAELLTAGGESPDDVAAAADEDTTIADATQRLDLHDDADDTNTRTDDPTRRRRLLEIGCGVGNLIFPLIREQRDAFYIYACDFSPRAVDFVRQNELYDERDMRAFQCDITCTGAGTVFEHIERGSLDIVTMVFVLSAIHPAHFAGVFERIGDLLRPGGRLLFRDYGRHDMAQLRFKAGHKIADGLYMRQDGTRSYFFGEQEVADLARAAGFAVHSIGYVHRRTVNVKEGVDAGRVFVQGTFVKAL